MKNQIEEERLDSFLRYANPSQQTKEDLQEVVDLAWKIRKRGDLPFYFFINYFASLTEMNIETINVRFAPVGFSMAMKAVHVERMIDWLQNIEGTAISAIPIRFINFSLQTVVNQDDLDEMAERCEREGRFSNQALCVKLSEDEPFPDSFDPQNLVRVMKTSKASAQDARRIDYLVERVSKRQDANIHLAFVAFSGFVKKQMSLFCSICLQGFTDLSLLLVCSCLEDLFAQLVNDERHEQIKDSPLGILPHFWSLHAQKHLGEYHKVFVKNKITTPSEFSEETGVEA